MQIKLEHLTKRFGDTVAVNDLSITLESGKLIALLGPSGCGKTTTLNMISGILPVSGGSIFFDDRDVTSLPPEKRGIGLVFQNYALYPHMTVAKNISFGLKNYGYGKEEAKKITDEVLELVGLQDYANVKPGNLSGGQRQRVALARAISKSPKVFLMDEPLSNLDAKLRVNMRSELIRMHQRLGSTFIYITHDQVEAMTMGDYIAVMKDGVIMQYGTPDEIYTDPQNIFTARFIGEPGMNIAKRPDGMSWGFRSAKVQFQEPSDFHGCVFRGTVLTRERLGDIYHYTISGENGDEYAVRSVAYFDFNEKVSMYIRQEDLYLFDANGDRVRELDLPQPQAGV